MPRGKVYLVGAGPGDIDLITLKGYRLICQADVILHDHLIPTELLRLAKGQAEIITVGKFASRHTMPQEQINALLVEKAAEHQIVVRLKGGDPFLFGRGGEEAEACAQAGVDFELVPGVTSALAAPSYAGIPPTHRDFTPSVAIVTGHRKDEKEIEIPNAGTIVFLMGVSNVEKIVGSLLKAGWSPQTKIAAIERGTFYNQRVVTGTLESFVQTVQEANLGTPAVLIVGKVVELHEKLNWFGRKPRILVLGTHPEKYAHLGTIVHRPIVECVGLEDYSRLDEAIKRLGEFDWLVFTSANGARFFFERLRRSGCDARALHAVKVAVIGTTTARELTTFGILADLVADTQSSAGLLEKFRTLKMKDKKVLVPQAKAPVLAFACCLDLRRGTQRQARKHGGELSEGLVSLGAAVEEVAVYRTVEIEPADVDFGHIDKILFTSGSTVRAFVKKFGRVPSHIKAHCLGIPTQQEARRHGIDAEILPQQGN